METTTNTENDENSETTIVTETDDSSEITATSKTVYIFKCPNGMKYFKCSECSHACDRIERNGFIRAKRSVYKTRPNIWYNGKCLYPQQCEFRADSFTYEVERFN